MSDFDGSEETSATLIAYDRILNLRQLLLEDFAHFLSVLRHFLFYHSIDGCFCHGHSKRVTSVSAAMLTWFDVKHDVVIAEYSTNGHKTAREGFTDNKNIRLLLFQVPFVGHHFACAAKTCLDLVQHHQYVVLGAKSSHLF